MYLWYLLNRRLRGLQSQSGWFGEEINLLCLPETQPQFLGHSAHTLVTTPTVVPWLLHRNFPAIIYLFILSLNKFELCGYVQVIESRRMRWAGHVMHMGEERGVYRVLVGKPEGKRPLGRPRRRRVDNIRMDLQEVGCGYMDWIGLAQDGDRWWTLVSAVMNLRVPWNAGNFLTSCKPVSCSRRTLHHGVSK